MMASTQPMSLSFQISGSCWERSRTSFANPRPTEIMRFGFVTCVQLGLSCLEEIRNLGGRPDLLVTLRDDLGVRKAGRIYVDDLASAGSIPVNKCRNINDPETVSAIRAADLDWLFIIGWSQIAREEVLAAPKQGVLGMHPTLLPQGRGRASIPWAIIRDLPETGVTLFKLDAGVDTGAVLGQERISVEAGETATSLYAKVIAAHLDLIRSTWPSLARSAFELTPQDDTLASEWPGRTPEDGRISPASMTVAEVDRLVRGTRVPYPGAFVDTPRGRMTVWEGTPDHGTAPVGAMTIELTDGLFFATRYEARLE